MLFKHLIRLLARGSLIECTHHEISRLYIMVHVLQSFISNKSSGGVTVAVCTPLISSTPLWHNWHMGWNHSLLKWKYAQTWYRHDEVWCDIIGCASFCYYSRTSPVRPGSSPCPLSCSHRQYQNLKDPYSSRSSDFKDKSCQLRFCPIVFKVETWDF